MAWPKGKPRDPANRGGRQKGTPNKASLPWKELAATASEDLEAQENLLDKVRTDAYLLLKVAEHAHGKPHQSMDVSMKAKHFIEWPVRVATDEDVRGPA